MTSVNTALQVDLFGQANASRIGGRIHSGFGGADRLHRRGAALARRAGAHRAAVVAPQGRRLDDRAAAGSAGYVLPADARS